MMQVLLATASNGRGLRGFVATRSAYHPLDSHFDFIIMPGGTINSIGNAICKKLDRLSISSQNYRHYTLISSTHTNDTMSKSN